MREREELVIAIVCVDLKLNQWFSWTDFCFYCKYQPIPLISSSCPSINPKCVSICAPACVNRKTENYHFLVRLLSPPPPTSHLYSLIIFQVFFFLIVNFCNASLSSTLVLCLSASPSL